MLSAATLLFVMSKIPAECSFTGQCPKGTIGHYEHGKDAKEIANVVSDMALEDKDAIQAIVFAAYESGMNASAVGDGGRSHGAWQIKMEIPDLHEQLKTWMVIKNMSVNHCGNLNELAGGTCKRASKLTNRREMVVNDLMKEIQ